MSFKVCRQFAERAFSYSDYEAKAQVKRLDGLTDHKTKQQLETIYVRYNLQKMLST